MKKTIKKVMYTSLVVGTIMPLMANSVQATTNAPVNQQVTAKKAISTNGDVEINATNFPDASFRAQLAPYDTDKNGKLSSTEISNITSLWLDNISDVTGIKLLTSLKTLTVKNSSLGKIDLRGMKSLTGISYDFNNPNLKELDLRNCPNLFLIRKIKKGCSRKIVLSINILLLQTIRVCIF